MPILSLTQIDPLSRTGYITLINDFIDFLFNRVEQESINNFTGWREHLENFHYVRSTEYNLADSIKKHLDYSEQFQENLNDTQLQLLVNKILKWGGLGRFPFKDDEISEVKKSIKQLRNFEMDNFENWERNLAGRRIASFSKVYEFYNPCQWTIYDSRVGRTLQYFVKKYFEQNLGQIENSKDLLGFRCPNSPTRGPISGNVIGYTFAIVNTPTQGRLGFLYASWLFKAISEKLNEGKIPLPIQVREILQERRLPLEWQVYHVEMVMFMIGKYVS